MVRVGVQDKVKKIVEDVSSVAADAGKKQILRLTDMDIEIIRKKQLSSLFLPRRERAMCLQEVMFCVSNISVVESCYARSCSATP